MGTYVQKCTAKAVADKAGQLPIAGGVDHDQGRVAALHRLLPGESVANATVRTWRQKIGTE